MAFEVYESKTLARRHVPVVTVQKRGAISINRAGYLVLGEPDHVLLLRDVEENLIAVKPARADDVHGHMVRLLNPARGSGPVVVPASDFVRDVGIDTTVARRWVAQHQDGMLVVDLKTEGVVVVSNRERTRTRAVGDELPDVRE
ncbi:hypothetical protein AA983_14330 [Dermacoccus sp. PE3]|uniref:hypothetical protein n=1 Tax=Dermacoccus sp. PE3 TaxID=1641401 RepID=UPI0006426498|nr:hypothetical protein [Dermacoccus sp. PE3]KLO61743.1 hypothetical protein AA983_14330 [Dermacoccus sp. PE3]